MLSHTRRKDTLSSQSSFCTILQSAVYILYLIYILYPDCTLHSSVCSLHFALTGIRGTNTVYFWLQLFAQHGRYKKKKNQLLLVSSTSRPNLLCFGFDLTQSQSSKSISRNVYGPNRLKCYIWQRWETYFAWNFPQWICEFLVTKIFFSCKGVSKTVYRGILHVYKSRHCLDNIISRRTSTVVLLIIYQYFFMSINFFAFL